VPGSSRRASDDERERCRIGSGEPIQDLIDGVFVKVEDPDEMLDELELDALAKPVDATGASHPALPAQLG
jgi:hypothetical protein